MDERVILSLFLAAVVGLVAYFAITSGTEAITSMFAKALGNLPK